MAQIANRGAGQPSAPGGLPPARAPREPIGTPPTGRSYSSSQRAAALEHVLNDETPGPDVDWERISIFGTGMALGLAVGAGVALLLAPRSGAESRSYLMRRTRRLGSRGRDAWDELRDELRLAARRGGRTLRRSAKHTAWAAEDAMADSRLRRRHRMSMEDC